MNIIYRNLFAKLRSDNFDTHDTLEPMSAFKMQKLMGLMKNIADMPAGEVGLNNSMLNKRFKRMQQRAATQHTTSRETIYLVRIIISNLHAHPRHPRARHHSIRAIPALAPRTNRCQRSRSMAATAPHQPHGATARQRAHQVLWF